MPHFHFTIGPVQSFITQARRSRDLWAGSLLLSWLSGVAMAAVRLQDSQARIVFPLPQDGVMKRITPDWPDDPSAPPSPPLADNDALLRQGSIPNRFMAEVGAGFDGAAVAGAVRQAFTAIADDLWREDFANLRCEGWDAERTHAIWQRQTAQFWDIAWVIDTHAGSGPPLLDARKNWRGHFLPTEPGIKCAAMDGWQELSGATGPGDPLLTSFWGAVHTRIAEKHANDLQEGEHLSAIAWVKRRFVRVFNGGFQATVQVGKQPLRLRGWPLSGNVPSVVYMAAVPWLADALPRLGEPEVAGAAQAFLEAVDRYEQATTPDRHALTLIESKTRIQCLVDAAKAHAAPDAAALARRLHSLDGGLFFKDDLQNPQIFPADIANPKPIAQKLGALCKSLAATPQRFYALLRMDGDRIGVRMGQPQWREVIAGSLNRFTSQAVGIVQAHSGFLLYAGGDDVLALFALPHVLPAAQALAGAFSEAFNTDEARRLLKEGEALPTLSGGVVFAQAHVPLASVVLASQRLLDDVAKKQAGRNALAVQVIKPGGPLCTWAMNWSSSASLQALISLSGAHTQVFSAGFLHRLRELHEQWFMEVGEQDEGPFKPQITHDLLLAELTGTRRADGVRWTPEQAQAALAQLMPLLRVPGRRHWQPDAAVLVRFLSQKGNP